MCGARFYQFLERKGRSVEYPTPPQIPPPALLGSPDLFSGFLSGPKKFEKTHMYGNLKYFFREKMHEKIREKNFPKTTIFIEVFFPKSWKKLKILPVSGFPEFSLFWITALSCPTSVSCLTLLWCSLDVFKK